MKKVLLIVNPKAGKGLIKGHLLEVVDTFVKSGMDGSTAVPDREEAGCF